VAYASVPILFADPLFAPVFLVKSRPNSHAEADVLEELQTWWQNLGPEVQEAIRTGGLVLAALLGGHFLGVMVTALLRSKNFDAALRLPGSPAGTEAGHGITPTFVGGLLVRLTVWAWAAAWVARQYGYPELTARLGLIISRTWALAMVLTPALIVASALSQRLVQWLQGPAKAAADPAHQRSVAGAVGAAVYGVVVLLALLVAADLFDWPLTRSSALALWGLAHNLLIAGAALFIGCLGARWARDQATVASAASPEQRAGQYTALGIVSATSVLAVAVLLSSAGLLLGLAAVGVLGFLLWLLRGYLPDVVAGLQLRTHHVREVWFDGVAWQVAEVGLLTTNVCRQGEYHRVQNRLVMEARLHGAPAEAAPR
jgi:hypothetical protein